MAEPTTPIWTPFNLPASPEQVSVGREAALESFRTGSQEGMGLIGLEWRNAVQGLAEALTFQEEKDDSLSSSALDELFASVLNELIAAATDARVGPTR
jgi:hypothetical protein